MYGVSSRRCKCANAALIDTSSLRMYSRAVLYVCLVSESSQHPRYQSVAAPEPERVTSSVPEPSEPPKKKSKMVKDADMHLTLVEVVRVSMSMIAIGVERALLCSASTVIDCVISCVSYVSAHSHRYFMYTHTPGAVPCTCALH